VLKLDLKNKRILTVLDEDVRAPLSKIASRVGLSKQLVDYRIKVMMKKGFIKGFTTHVDLTKLGYSTFGCYLRLRNLIEQREQEIIDLLVKHPYTRWVVVLEGKWDLAFALSAKNIVDFNAKFEEILDQIEENVETYDTNIIYSIQNFYMDLLERKEYYKEKPLRKEFSTEPDQTKIDELDIRILQELGKNARATLVDIANKLKTSSDVIRYRLKNLIAKKIISEFRLRTSLEALGYNWYQLIIDLRRFQEADEKKFLARIRQIPNLSYVVRCMGKWDFELHIHAKSNMEYRKILMKVRDILAGFIISYDSLMIFNKYKSTTLPQGVVDELIKEVERK